MESKKYIAIKYYTYTKKTNFILSGPRTAEEWKEHGISPETKFYEFDLSKMNEVKMELIISNL